MGEVAKLTDYAVAWYLDEHIMGGYRFLMNQHKLGDKICVSSFARLSLQLRALMVGGIDLWIQQVGHTAPRWWRKY